MSSPTFMLTIFSAEIIYYFKTLVEVVIFENLNAELTKQS
jgi:hypothetical protein